MSELSLSPLNSSVLSLSQLVYLWSFYWDQVGSCRAEVSLADVNHIQRQVLQVVYHGGSRHEVGCFHDVMDYPSFHTVERNIYVQIYTDGVYDNPCNS